MKNSNWALVIILVINAVLALYPAFVFNAPVTQTDGATYYALARTYAEGGISAENPAYNKPGSLEQHVSDYPPFAVVTFGLLLKYVGHDVFWINGAYTAVFFLLSTFFVYLLFFELTKDRNVALLGSLFSALNFRAYFSHLTGHYPYFVSFCLIAPSLYFTLKYFRTGRNSYLCGALALTVLTYLTYTPIAAFLTLLEIGLVIGISAKEKVQLKLPKIEAVWKEKKDLFGKSSLFLLPMLILAAVLTKLYLFAASGRQGFLSSIIAALLKMGDGYPKAWGYFLVVDGPFIVTLAAIGLLYLLWKQEWDIISLFVAASVIVAVNLFVIPVGVFARYFVYRFYPFFFILLALPASVMIVNGLKNKHTRFLFSLILIFTLLFQVGELGFLYGKLEPAITQDEMQVAQFLAKDPSIPITYVKNYKGDSSFRDFKWLLVYSKLNNFVLEQEMPETITTRYILIQDYSALDPAAKQKIANYKPVFSSGTVVIKEQNA